LDLVGGQSIGENPAELGRLGEEGIMTVRRRNVYEPCRSRELRRKPLHLLPGNDQVTLGRNEH
jgi:hypothetical protein